MNNSYLVVLHRNLPRLLGQVNLDQTDPYYGCADRQFWGWKVIDFPNATNQASVYGLAILRANNMLPNYISKNYCLNLIIAMINVIPKLTTRHNGLSEAIPNESSFCTTSFVLSNILAAFKLIEKDLSKKEKKNILSICRPLVNFLKKQDEYHGIISNHLATASLAMRQWFNITKDKLAKQRCSLWLNRIRKHADLSEGWMSEYGGADPGYQSWALSELVKLKKEGEYCDDLIKPCYDFLSYFAMPDGSFANGIGDRLTRFFFPGGAEIEGKALAYFARKNIQENNFVNLDSIDPPNFAPFFNDLALAAVNIKSMKKIKLPYQKMSIGESKILKKAGLIIYRSRFAYKIFSVKRCDDYVGTDGKRIYTAVNGRIILEKAKKIKICGDIIPVKRMMPSVLSFIILRILSISAFQFLYLGNKVKVLLAKLLIKSNPRPIGKLILHLNLETDKVKYETKNINLKQVSNKKGFSRIHMASQGYWQKRDTN